MRIGVGDLAAAADEYALLLGGPGRMLSATLARFDLDRGAVELEAAPPPGARALRFVPASGSGGAAAWPDGPEAYHGLDVRVGPPSAAGPAAGGGRGVAIDHVVIRTSDCERAARLWRDRLGVRLASARDVPERGLRMLFFRSAGVTLEFVSPLAPSAGDAAEPDRLWGVAYRVPDLAAWRARLCAAGVDVSPIRDGHRPGTRVATVRSHTGGVPTLLLEIAGARPGTAA